MNTGSISGTVTDPGASPLGNVQVCANSDSTFNGSCSETTADGTYSISGLAPASDYRVEFFDLSNVHSSQLFDGATNFGQATLVAVVGGQDTSGIDAQLALGGSISGTVTDSGNSPLVGIQVCANSNSNSFGNCAQTDTDGTYTIGGLAGPGDYNVDFFDFSSVYVSEFFDDVTGFDLPTVVSVVAGQVTPNIDAQLEVAGSISGTVAGAGAGPLGGIQVCAFSDSGVGGNCSQTASDGSYSIGGLPAASDYRVDFTDFSNVYLFEFFDDSIDFFQATFVTVVGGQDTSNIDAELALGGSISGMVTGAGVGPLAGIQVCAFSDAGFFGSCAQTSTDGTYSIGGLVTASDYRVDFSDNNNVYASEFFDDVIGFGQATLVAVVGGQDTSGIDAELALGGSISGMVTGAGAGPLGGIQVCAFSDSGLGGNLSLIHI